MITLTQRSDGCVIPVKAQPGARKNAITGQFAGSLKVAVTAAPEKGKANQAIAKLLAQTFGLAKRDVELIAGQSSAEKKFLLVGANVQEIATALGTLLVDEE